MKPSKLPQSDHAAAVAELLLAYRTLYVQQKFNGVGFRAELTADNVLRIYTTRNKTWPSTFFNDQQRYELRTILAHFEDEATLYGEIVSADQTIPLATLAGWVSVNRAAMAAEADINFVVYDVSSARYPMSFSARAAKLKVACRYAYTYFVQPARTEMHTAAEPILAAYNNIIAKGGEGIILRADPCFFCEDRSPLMWKMKRKHDAEGRCISVEEGKGKRRGLLGALYVQTSAGPLKIGGGPGMTDKLLKELLHNPPIGKQITYSYEELSVNGLPLRPQFVAVRSYED